MDVATAKPINDRVLVKLAKSGEERRPSGLLIPDVRKKAADRARVREGVVKAVGPGRMLDDGRRLPVSDALRPGARVLFVEWTVHDDSFGEHALLREDDVMAVLEE